MSKETITRTFVGSLVALAGGLVLLFVAGGLALTNDTLVMDGPDVVGVRGTPFGWVMIGLAVLAVLTLIGAAVAEFVAWVGAVVNTSQRPDKTWFVVLLVMGLLSFGFLALVVYLVAGPDDPRPVQLPPAAPDASADVPTAVA